MYSSGVVVLERRVESCHWPGQSSLDEAELKPRARNSITNARFGTVYSKPASYRPNPVFSLEVTDSKSATMPSWPPTRKSQSSQT
jgi:hypothetical protein